MNGVRPPIPKIAFVTHSLARGGSPIFLYEHCKVLKRKGAEIFLISEKGGPLGTAFEQLGIPVFIAPRAGPLELGLIFNLRRILRRESAALVHLNTFSSYYKYGLIAARLARLPVVWGIREDVTTRRCLKLAWWIKNFADRIVPCSYEIASKLYPAGAPVKVRVVHDGIPLSTDPAASAKIDLRTSFHIAASAKIVGCVAALEPRKGIKELIEAFSILLKQGIDAHLVCVGEDRSPNHAYQPMLSKRIDELGCAKRVHLLGGRSDAGQLYRQFDVFALATYWEGIARVLLEAAQAGCPVVTTKAGGNGELIHEQRGGLLAPPGDVQALSNALAYILNNPSFAQTSAEYSRQVVEREFDLDKCVGEMIEIYRECVA